MARFCHKFLSRKWAAWPKK